MAESKKRESEAGTGPTNKKFKSRVTAAEAEGRMKEKSLLAQAEKKNFENKARVAGFEVESWEAMILIIKFLEAHWTGHFAAITGVEDAEKTRARLMYNFLNKSTDANSVLISDSLSELMGKETISNLLDSVKICENGHVYFWNGSDRADVHWDNNNKVKTTCKKSNHVDIEHRGIPSYVHSGKKWMAYTNKK